MGIAKLDLRMPQSAAWGKISAEPDPYWTLDSLIAELKSFEIKNPLPPPSSPPPSLSTLHRRDATREAEKTGARFGKGFVMCISDDDIEDADGDMDGGTERSLMAGTRFSCHEADFSDSEGSDVELDRTLEQQWPRIHLMDRTSLAECFLFELEREHQLRVKEEIRKKASALEAELRSESKRSLSALVRLEKHTEARRELDRQVDKQFQRKIAEALDRHLSVVQRDHEQRSQIEERRIKDDAALEEAKRKERALLEEKALREKAEAEASQEAARIAEEQKKAALEAARASVVEQEGKDDGKTEEAVRASVVEPKVAISGDSPIAADFALRAEAERLMKHEKGAELYDKLASSSDRDFNKYQLQIARTIRQLTWTVDSVRTKSSELSNIMKDPRCPYPVSLVIFAKKILSLCENPRASFDGTAFAVGHVIVRVTAQVPAAMDFVLAEFHKACIFTVPKYFQPPKGKNRDKEYQKMIGYREEDGKIENTDSYLQRIESHMKLYAALVQTESGGAPNPHGIKEGWSWLARFLNMLPANIFTAVALVAFLKMAGFALFQKYKAQFAKVLNVISNKFLPALKAQGGPDVHTIIIELEAYLEKKLYLRQPDGRRLEASLTSTLCMP